MSQFFSHILLTLPLMLAFGNPTQARSNSTDKDAKTSFSTKSPKLVHSLISPKSEKPHSLDYDLGDTQLKENEALVLEIPQKYIGSDWIVDFAAITHRQSPDEEFYNEGRCYSTEALDCFPGYVSVEFHLLNSDPKLGWVVWGKKGNGPKNSKFSEIRKINFPETDNLYEWMHNGYQEIYGSQNVIKEPLATDSIRLVATGPDSIRVNKFIIKFAVPKPSEIQEFAFSEGTKLGDFTTGIDRYLPGRHSCGRYGNYPLRFGPRSTPSHKRIPPNWILRDGSISIPISEGKELTTVDVAIGDKKESCYEEDRGGAMLSVARVQIRNRKEVVLDELMVSENIGTSGVMRALPSKEGEISGSDEYLRISILRDSASIMALRLGLR